MDARCFKGEDLFLQGRLSVPETLVMNLSNALQIPGHLFYIESLERKQPEGIHMSVGHLLAKAVACTQNSTCLPTLGGMTCIADLPRHLGSQCEPPKWTPNNPPPPRAYACAPSLSLPICGETRYG